MGWIETRVAIVPAWPERCQRPDGTFHFNVPSASIRFGLGRFTTEEEIDYAIEKFAAVVSHLRGTSVHAGGRPGL